VDSGSAIVPALATGAALIGLLDLAGVLGLDACGAAIGVAVRGVD